MYFKYCDISSGRNRDSQGTVESKQGRPYGPGISDSYRRGSRGGGGQGGLGPCPPPSPQKISPPNSQARIQGGQEGLAPPPGGQEGPWPPAPPYTILDPPMSYQGRPIRFGIPDRTQGTFRQYPGRHRPYQLYWAQAYWPLCPDPSSVGVVNVTFVFYLGCAQLGCTGIVISYFRFKI